MMLVLESYETISSISGEIKIDGGFNTKTIAEKYELLYAGSGSTYCTAACESCIHMRHKIPSLWMYGVYLLTL